MSYYEIAGYRREVERIKRFSGETKETSIRNAFFNLINAYAKQKALILVAESSLKRTQNSTRTPDGTLYDSLRLPHGYWESKDEKDDLDDEIREKFAKGYPRDNILFEDSRKAVLYQAGLEVMRVDISNDQQLDLLLHTFVEYERPEVRGFREAIELFKADVPRVTDALRKLIEDAEQISDYRTRRDDMLEQCRKAINPAITREDIHEMLIQHILTADIFNTIFDEVDFHRFNNVARQIEEVVGTFFTRELRKQLLDSIHTYYEAINSAAANIRDHHEKQRFLKVVYENFYKSYNPKAADRLGVVYTPNEIVQFMIESTDYLLHRHFGKLLEDEGVDILDPATGTGTFLCDLIDHFTDNALTRKYENELHANEVAILPYYIANLNIEYIYRQRTGHYNEFTNLCFADTLDNMGFHRSNAQLTLNFSDENSERIRRQNDRRISVVIGNPPYNANQKNENENNKNREYPEIDKRIKETFIRHSKAQKTKAYDMYVRFYRWAMDRIDDNGIVAFVTNRSFIDARNLDGFRKCVQDDFDYAYIIDTKSDVRTNPKISGTANNVFGIQTGVAIMFLVREQNTQSKRCNIQYFAMEDDWRKDAKLEFLSANKIPEIPFTHILPDKDNNWLNQTDNDWDSLMPVADKKLKRANQGVIFSLFSLGVVTNRDEWVYDYSRENLEKKIKYFFDMYNTDREKWNQCDRSQPINDFVNRDIKWTSELEAHLCKNNPLVFSGDRIRLASFRPFISTNTYFDRIITHRPYCNNEIYPINSPEASNLTIAFSGLASTKAFVTLATNRVCDLHFVGDSQCLPLYTYTEDGERIDNITDWALTQFRNQYGPELSKQDIFHYVYAVLHDPVYRRDYAINLSRSLPRIPFKTDFFHWRDWGRSLMELHLGYENATPWPLVIRRAEITDPQPKLKADRTNNVIVLDESVSLADIPPEAWDYKLGNRSALEWVLDQYKEKKVSDPTIAAKFNTYRFADYREKVVDLLLRLTTVSVETVRIQREMEQSDC
jgi:predicted helicase